MSRAELGEFDSNPQWCSSPTTMIVKIIIVDQFSRHIYRTQNTQQIKLNDSMSLRWAEQMISRGWHKSLPVDHFIFMLMPFRHNGQEDKLKYVLAQLTEREQKEEENTKLFDRFKKTTLRKIYDLHEHAAVTEDTNILEHFPFDADESGLLKEKLSKCMSDFLKKHLTPTSRYTVVSLSGGVDSMVISKILQKLAPIMKFEVIAIHIDYANRPESGLEADYVEQWCKKIGIHFEKRVINEVTRGITDRDLYEKESRRIRFETYQNVLNQYGTDAGIMLGHHKGDEQENIITNIMKGRESILNLSGMTMEGVICNVKIWRPFLLYTKKYIFDFAHKYGVPYFLDTTPKWSNRGRMRCEVQPLLADVFGAGYLKNISTIGGDSAELAELTVKYVFGPFWKTLRIDNVGVSINVSKHRNESKLFWKETLRHIFHSVLETSTIHDKSMPHFLKRLSVGTDDEKGIWVSLKKENPSLLLGDHLIILKENFRVHKDADEEEICYWPNKQQVAIGKHIFANPNGKAQWTVVLEECPADAFLANEFSIWDILSGDLVYYLPACTSYTIDFNSRIKPFRLISPFITKAIPIVSRDGTETDTTKCTKVRLLWTDLVLQKPIHTHQDHPSSLSAAVPTPEAPAATPTKAIRIDREGDAEGPDVPPNEDDLSALARKTRKEKKARQRELQRIKIEKVIQKNKELEKQNPKDEEETFDMNFL